MESVVPHNSLLVNYATGLEGATDCMLECIYMQRNANINWKLDVYESRPSFVIPSLTRITTKGYVNFSCQLSTDLHSVSVVIRKFKIEVRKSWLVKSMTTLSVVSTIYVVPVVVEASGSFQ